MTTDKTNVQRYTDMGSETICPTNNMRKSDDGYYVLYEDYESLQAQYEKLLETVQGEPVAFCEDTALSIAERTFNTEVDEHLASDIIQYAQRLHSLYTAPQPSTHWSHDNPGLADQYRAEALAARRSVGFEQGADDVAPTDISAAIESLTRTAQDVAQLVEALKWLRGAINCTPENDKQKCGAWISTQHPRIRQIDELLATYHKQGGDV